MQAPAYATFGAALVLLGAYAEAAFFCMRASRTMGDALVFGGLALFWVASAIVVSKRRRAPRANVLDAWGPWSSTDWLHLPSDNVLPDLSAKQVLSGAPPRPFAGDWLSSDRPPLQAGFDVVAARIVAICPGASTSTRSIRPASSPQSRTT